MHQVKFGIFFDFHTMPACPDVGAGFDAEAVTDELKECGVDYISFPARCNLGMAYYNTKVGIRHPALKYDLFGSLAKACARKKIALSAYVNVGLSHEEALLHREWCVITQEGYTYAPDRLNHFFRWMCYNSGYGDHLVEMIKEIVSGYPVSGLFLDCMNTTPCMGVECIRKMKENGLDWSDEKQLRNFSRATHVGMARRIAEAASKTRKDLMLYFNGVAYEDQQDIGNYLELECLPTAGFWGWELLPVCGRYLRTLGKPVLNMTGRFQKAWGDFGGLRPEAGLEYDCLYGLANGMRPNIGDHFHPRGDINKAVFSTYKRVYGKMRKLEPWMDGAKNLADAAVVHLETWPGYKSESSAKFDQCLMATKAATRMMSELKQQFDVVSANSDWSGYELLILPDFVVLDDAGAAKIKKHLHGGGRVISSAWSGMDPELKGFVLDAWGVKYLGPSPYDPAYFLPLEKLAMGMPDMPMALYDRGISMAAEKGAQVLARIVAPYYNTHWDGEHGFLYTPPDKLTKEPAVIATGQVGHVSHPIFTTYYNSASLQMRQLISNLLELYLPRPLVRAESLPSFARVMVTAQPQRRIVHVLAYVPERRGGNSDVVEERIELRDKDLMLRIAGRAPQKVYLAPDLEDLPFEVINDYVKVRIPVIDGHAHVVFEE